MSDSASDSRSSPPSAAPARGPRWPDLPVIPVALALVGAFGAAIAAGFGAGMSWYKLRLEMTQRDEVPRGSYILKKDFHGIVLTTQAWIQINELIENSKRDDPASWLLESKTFVSGLDLP